MLVDTHCHIHDAGFSLDKDETLARARQAGIEKMICVGTDMATSYQAYDFAAKHEGVWAAIGVHPHEAKTVVNDWFSVDDGMKTLLAPTEKGKSTVAVGEIGLDYFYEHSPRQVQIDALEAQLQQAKDHGLPVIFHVRDTVRAGEISVWQDFWPIFDNFPGLRGVLHSFTDTRANLEQGLTRGLYVGVNGISTFTRDAEQQATFDAVPLDNLLFETDAPFLTPAPLRGKVNEPAYVRMVAEFHADRRNLSIDELAAVTTRNAHALFAI